MGACISAPREAPQPVPEAMLAHDDIAEDALHLPGTDRRWALEEPRGQPNEAAASTQEEAAASAHSATPASEVAQEHAEAPVQPPEQPPAAVPENEAELRASVEQPPVAALPPSPAQKGSTAPKVAPSTAPPSPVVDPTGPLRVARGEGLEPIVVPREETLLFRVYVSLGWFGQPSVGRVQLSARVEPFRASALSREAPSAERGERGVLIARAWGSYSIYELDETITTLLLPQAWPAVIHRSAQSGTENRRRELRLGMHPENGSWVWYRADRHCSGCDDRAHFVKPSWAWQDEKHCKRCKRGEHRVWRQPEERAVTAGAVDMLSAVLLARALIADGRQEMKFLLLDKVELWEVSVTRGEEKLIEVPAGKFAASQVILRTAVPPGEQGREEDFEGLFGIQGDISIWFEKHTGVPVQISGKIPAGPLRLEVSINLAEFSGTPQGFQPLP